MNSNLSVGGSAQNILTGGGRGLPENFTLVGFSYLYGAYHRVVIGSGSVADGAGLSATGSLDRLEASIFLRHFIGDGWSTSLSIPAGTVRFDPGTGLSSGQRSGLGDILFETRYDFSAIWGQSLERPSLELITGLALPTGKQETIGSLSPSFPPQIVGVGRAVFAFLLGVDYTQFLHHSFALKANFALAQPMTETSQSILFGPAYTYGVGGMFLQDDEVFYSAQVIGNVQMPSYKSGVDITNSGSHVVGLDASIGKKMSDKISLVGQLHVPLYIGTQGTQVAESFTISGAITMSFGGESAKKSSHDHDHDAHDHDAHDHDAHDHDAHDHDAHGHSHSEHSSLDESNTGSTNEGEDSRNTQSEVSRLQEEIRRLRAQTERTSAMASESLPAPSRPVSRPAETRSTNSKSESRTGKRSRFSVRVDEEDKTVPTPKKQRVSESVQKPAPAISRPSSSMPKVKAADVKDLALGGKSFALNNAAVKGKITVLDFWADWCRPCKKISALLEELAAEHSNLAIRKIEVPTFESAVAIQHLNDVSGLPVVWIYDTEGERKQKLVGTNAKDVRRALKSLLSK